MVTFMPSRDRLLAAAAREFAARGYDGAGVDRIARAARLNKAMIYYHFKSKAGLYNAIVRDVFGSILAAVTDVADSALPPEEKIRAFVRAIGNVARARPHFPPLWLNEFSTGARHVEEATLRNATRVVEALARIIQDGVESRRFRAANPIMVHVGIVAPILLFLVSQHARARLARAGAPSAGELTLDDVLEHVTRSALGNLCTNTGEADA